MNMFQIFSLEKILIDFLFQEEVGPPQGLPWTLGVIATVPWKDFCIVTKLGCTESKIESPKLWCISYQPGSIFLKGRSSRIQWVQTGVQESAFLTTHPLSKWFQYMWRWVTLFKTLFKGEQPTFTDSPLDVNSFVYFFLITPQIVLWELWHNY